MLNSYKDLIVWQKSMDLAVEIYKLTSYFPKCELYRIVSQMKRSAISIPSNIADGRRRGSRKDYRQFMIIAYASASELETQIELSKRLALTEVDKYGKVDTLMLEVLKMLNVITSSLKS